MLFYFGKTAIFVECTLAGSHAGPMCDQCKKFSRFPDFQKRLGIVSIKSNMSIVPVGFIAPIVPNEQHSQVSHLPIWFAHFIAKTLYCETDYIAKFRNLYMSSSINLNFSLLKRVNIIFYNF